MFLTTQELAELTHRSKGAWQAKALEQMGIPFRRRPDGSVVVLRADLERKQDQRPVPRLRAG